MHIEQDIRIPKLRRDLKVYQGGYDLDGSPTWMLYDPLSDNYFKIGWFEFECLQRFEKYESAGQLAVMVGRETTLTPDIADVKDFIAFLLYSGLLVANTKDIQNLMLDHKEKNKGSFLKKVAGRLYSTIPLFEPQQFLVHTYPYIKFLFTRGFFTFVLCLLAVGIFLTIQRWDDFLNTFTTFLSLQGLLMVFATTVFVKIFHEFGHAFMAHKYNVPVSVMGVVFIVIYPILYTETTNAWRLYNRQKRMQIAAAGLLAELSLASFALILWHVLPSGVFQNMAYFVAFVSLGISVFVNMNPLMKFDGYYLFSDFIGVDNLQSRAIQFLKWRLRRLLLGLDDSSPEVTTLKTERFFTLFGFALMTYRFFLYMGIGLLVYHLFFKPLGAVLMLVVVAAFIAAPVFKELMSWYEERERVIKNIKPRILFGVLICVVVLAFLPIQKTIKVPVVLHAQNYAALYTPMPSEIKTVHFTNGTAVKAGDVLFSLSSDELDVSITRAELDLDLYKKVKEREQSLKDFSTKNATIDQMISEAETRLNGLKKQRDQLDIKAPFAGVLRDISPDIHVGRWVNPEIVLGRVVDDSSISFTGYISGESIARVEAGAKGYFMPEMLFGETIDAVLVDVGQNDTKNIAYPELSSLFGGVIPSDVSGRSGEQITSRVPLYQLDFEPINKITQNIDFTKKGLIVLRVQPVSFAGKITKRLLSLFLRETSI